MSPRNILSYLLPLLHCQSIVFSSENGTQLEYYTVMYPDGRNFTYSRGRRLSYNDATAQAILDSHNAVRRELNLTTLVSVDFCFDSSRSKWFIMGANESDPCAMRMPIVAGYISSSLGVYYTCQVSRNGRDSSKFRPMSQLCPN